MNPYKVVEDFELALSEYTGAPYVVTTNSCSMAIQLCVALHVAKLSKCPTCGIGTGLSVEIPKRTYASVPNAVLNVMGNVEFVGVNWQGEYRMSPLNVWDSARRFRKGMYRHGQMQCVSFQTSKILGLEQGGAILHDNPEADEWLRRARFDGRLNASEKLPKMRGWHCYMNPSTAALGLQRLSCLPDDNPDNGGSYMFEDLSKLDIWK